MSALQDILLILRYLAAQKTLPPNEQKAMDRLVARADANLPMDVTVVTGLEQSRES